MSKQSFIDDYFYLGVEFQHKYFVCPNCHHRDRMWVIRDVSDCKRRSEAIYNGLVFGSVCLECGYSAMGSGFILMNCTPMVCPSRIGDGLW